MASDGNTYDPVAARLAAAEAAARKMLEESETAHPQAAQDPDPQPTPIRNFTEPTPPAPADEDVPARAHSSPASEPDHPAGPRMIASPVNFDDDDLGVRLAPPNAPRRSSPRLAPPAEQGVDNPPVDPRLDQPESDHDDEPVQTPADHGRPQEPHTFSSAPSSSQLVDAAEPAGQAPPSSGQGQADDPLASMFASPARPQLRQPYSTDDYTPPSHWNTPAAADNSVPGTNAIETNADLPADGFEDILSTPETADDHRPDRSHSPTSATDYEPPTTDYTRPPATETALRDPAGTVTKGLWRSTARRMGFGAKESADERLWRTMVRHMNRPLPGPAVIGFTATKGGGAKTTTAIAAAVAISRLRTGARVCAVDTDPLGDLVLRADGMQNSNILDFADAIARGDTQRPPLMARTVDGVDILGSPPSLLDESMSPQTWNLVLDALRARYDIIVVDMAVIEKQDPTYHAVLRSLDSLIITAPPTLAGTRLLPQIPQWLEKMGVTHLIDRRMIVIGKPDNLADQINVDALRNRARHEQVESSRVPFDRHLREASNTSFDDLSSETRKAFVVVAATAVKISS
ncbi:AAA family ATPase [Gordonia sihwensis]|uniref:AAA family ATPase n=1 Tax=Gordonia sihwensis TaxID=173559 RepID=UPI003D999A80